MAASSFKMLQIAKKIDRTADEQKQNEKKKSMDPVLLAQLLSALTVFFNLQCFLWKEVVKQAGGHVLLYG